MPRCGYPYFLVARPVGPGAELTRSAGDARPDERAVPLGTDHRQGAVERAHPVAQPNEPGALAFVRAPDPVILELDLDVVAELVRAQTHVIGLGVLEHVGQRLGDHEVGHRLDGGGRPVGQPELALHGHRRPRRQRLERRGEPAIAEDGGMDAARELAQLRERGGELLIHPVDQLLRLLVRAHAATQDPQLDGQGHELLLGAVVQVAFEPAPGRVGGLDDAYPRCPQLLDPRSQVGLQALVVERQRRRGGGGLNELGARLQAGVVDDRGHSAAVVVDRRPRPVGSGLGQRHRTAALIDEATGLGQPVGDRQRAVTEAPGQGLAHRCTRRQPRDEQRPGQRAQREGDHVGHGHREDRDRQRQ